MRIVKLSAIIVLFSSVILLNGCGMRDLKVRNETQQKRMSLLEAENNSNRLQIEQLKSQLSDCLKTGGVEADTLKQKLAALEKSLSEKEAMIAEMQQRLLAGGITLPAELNTLLEEFAAKEGSMVTYDPNRGVVKFKSDLLFESGSDKVASDKMEAIKALGGILNSAQAQQFDIIIAGHTDDQPIGKPETKAKHPTNWYLSAHRAISVLNLLSQEGISAERMSARGFGEYRPIAQNAANKKGNAQNRRVEIYIVKKGV